jgi:hypothetical protein
MYKAGGYDWLDFNEGQASLGYQRAAFLAIARST